MPEDSRKGRRGDVHVLWTERDKDTHRNLGGGGGSEAQKGTEEQGEGRGKRFKEKEKMFEAACLTLNLQAL